VKLLLVLAVLSLASRAWAQSSSDVAIGVLVIPPAALTLLFDGVMLSTMIPKGTASHGMAITNLVFGSITLVASLFSLIPGAFGDQTQFGEVVAGTGAAVGASSIALSIVALLRPEEQPTAEPPPPEGPSFRTPAVPRPPPPQLRVLPLFGARMIGLRVTL
jgi:hypothetical protein